MGRYDTNASLFMNLAHFCLSKRVLGCLHLSFKTRFFCSVGECNAA